MAERTKIGMSLDEFMARFEEQPFELINGEIRDVTPTKFQHSKVSKRIYNRLLFYETETEHGEAFFETAFVLEDRPDWIKGARVPDVIYIQKDRLRQYEAEIENINQKPLVLVPDLVVEVISPTDKYSDINTKVDAYLSDGVKLIWIVDPQRKTIAVYKGNDTAKILRIDDTLAGGGALPDFELSVKDIFGD